MNTLNQNETFECSLSINSNSQPKYNLEKGHGILVALSTVQKNIIEIGGIGKNRDIKPNEPTNKFNYKFRSIQDIYNVISPMLVDAGIVCTPHLEESKVLKYKSSKGDITFKSIVSVRYTLFCIHDGSFIESTLIGEANDSGDKGVSKAMTAAQKYLFTQMFSIPDETDQQNQQNQQPRLASLTYKNSVDSFMRKYQFKLIDALKKNNLDFHELTEEQLQKVEDKFKRYVAKNFQSC